MGEGSASDAGEHPEQDWRLMLGQKANHLDFRAMMDEGKILLLDLGRSDGETNRLIGSLVIIGLEMAMRRRRNRKLGNLTIDEFAGYVGNEGSVKTLAHPPDARGAFQRPDQGHLWDWPP